MITKTCIFQYTYSDPLLQHLCLCLVLLFAIVKLSIKSGNWKLHLLIARIIMETEIKNKHWEKKNFTKEIASISKQLKSILGLFLYNALIRCINDVIKSRYKAMNSRHEKKLQKFLTAQKRENNVSKPVLLNSIVHNFSSYNLTQEEHEALSYGLDLHIPTSINRNKIKTEFESFFQSLLYDLSDTPENEISKVKTKLGNTCEKYCHKGTL